MPGTYPRSTNPYFPFNRLDWVERQINLFHDLTYSADYRLWALTSVFSSFSGALAVADQLNYQFASRDGGRYVVVPADETLVWCRAATIEDVKYFTSEVVAWSAPVAERGYIIVWESEDAVVLTESQYLSYFKEVPNLDPYNEILWPRHYHHPYHVRPSVSHAPSIPPPPCPPLTYKPVTVLPILERCIQCGEILAFCRCTNI